MEATAAETTDSSVAEATATVAPAANEAIKAAQNRDGATSLTRSSQVD